MDMDFRQLQHIFMVIVRMSRLITGHRKRSDRRETQKESSEQYEKTMIVHVRMTL